MLMWTLGDKGECVFGVGGVVRVMGVGWDSCRESFLIVYIKLSWFKLIEEGRKKRTSP